MNTWWIAFFVLCAFGFVRLCRKDGVAVANLEEVAAAVDATFPRWNLQGKARHFFVRQVLIYSIQRRIMPARALAELLREVEGIPPQSLECLLSTLVDLDCVPPGEVVRCLEVCKEIYTRAGIKRKRPTRTSRPSIEPELLQALEVLKGVGGTLAQDSCTKARFKDPQALLDALRSQEAGSLRKESLHTAWWRNLLRTPTRSPFARALRAH